MNKPQPERINQHTVVTQVMNRIKTAIASGEYRPGDRLPSEAELTKMYGVGRSSVREAIKVFQHLGIVESRPAKGTIVCERANISVEAITWAVLLGKDDLSDVLDLREAIERASFSRLTKGLELGEGWAKEILKNMEMQVDLMLGSVKSLKIDQLIEADYKFHGFIIEAGRNELFQDIYRSLYAFMKVAVRAAYNEMNDLKIAAQEHVDILNTLREKTPNEAQDQHHKHFKYTRRLLKLKNS